MGRWHHEIACGAHESGLHERERGEGAAKSLLAAAVGWWQLQCARDGSGALGRHSGVAQVAAAPPPLISHITSFKVHCQEEDSKDS